ncbi:MAG: hypothetical protein ABL934_02510 [Lysobacteraceae bacterium]
MDDSCSNRLQRVSDDVLARIGRNLLTYQRIEKNLKHLDGSGRPITIDTTTTAESLIEQMRMNHSAVERYTLGNVMRRVIRIGDSPGNQSADRELVNCVTLSSETIFEDTPENHAWVSGFHCTVVDARNRLAHDFLGSVELDTIEGCEEACRHLDLEYEDARAFLHFTRSAATDRKQVFQSMAAFLQSDAFAEWYAQTSVLIDFTHALRAETERLARPDGWCAFTTAIQAVRASRPELIATLLSAQGYASVRAAAEATRAFEWWEERIKRGVLLLLRWLPE